MKATRGMYDKRCVARQIATRVRGTACRLRRRAGGERYGATMRID